MYDKQLGSAMRDVGVEKGDVTAIERGSRKGILLGKIAQGIGPIISAIVGYFAAQAILPPPPAPTHDGYPFALAIAPLALAMNGGGSALRRATIFSAIAFAFTFVLTATVLIYTVGRSAPMYAVYSHG